MNTKVLFKTVIIFILCFTGKNELSAQDSYACFFYVDSSKKTSYKYIKDNINTSPREFLNTLRNFFKAPFKNRMTELGEEKEIVIFEDGDSKDHKYILETEPLHPNKYIKVEVSCNANLQLAFHYREIDGKGREKRYADYPTSIKNFKNDYDIIREMEAFAKKIPPDKPQTTVKNKPNVEIPTVFEDYEDYEGLVNYTFDNIDLQKTIKEKMEMYKKVYNADTAYQKKYFEKNKNRFNAHYVKYRILAIKQVELEYESMEDIDKLGICHVIIESYKQIIDLCKNANIRDVDLSTELNRWKNKQNKLINKK